MAPAALPSAVRAAGIVVVSLLLTLLMTWPLARDAGHAVQDLGDPLYEIWTMRWTQHQLAADPARLWDGNVGYPFPRSFLFSEPRLSTSVLAWPIQLLTGNEVLSYNVMLLASFVLVAAGMALLTREITGSDGAALAAGATAAFVPYRYGHLSHLNLLSYGWLPLALWMMVRFARRRSALDAALAALLLTIQVLASDTIALIALGIVALVIPTLLWQERRRLTLGLVGGLLIVVLAPVLALIPIVQARSEVNALYGFSRDLDTVRAMSATLESYVAVAPGNWLWGTRLPLAYPNPLFPGVVTAVGAILGLTVGLRRWPRWVVMASALALGSCVLSLGPETTLAGRTFELPYRLLYDHVSLIRSMRDVARFGMATLLGLSLLAGLGFAAAWAMLRARISARTAGWLGPILAVLLLGSAAAELRTTVGVVPVPRGPEVTAVYGWLAEQPPGPVIEYPVSGYWENLAWTIEQIYHSTRHWNPIVAAYTSFLPRRYVDLLIELSGGPKPPSQVNRTNVGLLQDIGIRYVLIHRTAGYDWQRAEQEASRLPELTKLADFGTASVYQLAPGTRQPLSFRLAAPSTALAGQPVVASLATRNDNRNLALTTLAPATTLSATWLDAQGALVRDESRPLDVPVSVPSGLDVATLRLVAPGEPGRYRLRLDAGSLTEPIEQEIQVVAASGNARADQTRASAPLALRRIVWPEGVYRPGDWIELLGEWEVRDRIWLDYKASIQVIDPANRTLAQADGQPFRDDFPTWRWQPGATIILPMRVRLPDDERALAQPLRLMIAFYAPSHPDLPRLPLALPDGTVQPEYILGPVRMASLHQRSDGLHNER